jgi:16S rRNA (uracil1498-N3)-methyltransferase
LPVDAAPSLLLVDDLPGVGRRVTLSEDESHYLSRVCRARAGDRVSATDGRGALATVVLVTAGRSAVVEVERLERTETVRQAWVLAGSPEGERGDWLVEKLAELGVSVLQPLECERGAWEKMRGRTERWRRLAIAALRQSRRRFLLEIREPASIDTVLGGLPPEGGRWLADPAGAPAGECRPEVRGLSVGLIGPSAGLNPQEREAAMGAGFSPISLSDSRLRTETAAMAWACWWASPGAPASRAF